MSDRLEIIKKLKPPPGHNRFDVAVNGELRFQQAAQNYWWKFIWELEGYNKEDAACVALWGWQKIFEETIENLNDHTADEALEQRKLWEMFKDCK